MNETIDNLRANSVIMEHVTTMMLDQVGKDKLHYDTVALEAIAKPEGQAALLDKLYKASEKIEGVDFGRIPDTRGDITKYQYYGQLNDCIELINEITAGDPTDNIKAMNKLHQILLAARQDFEFGFKSDNYIIINLYKVMYLSLFELENACIVDMTDHIRKKLSINTNAKTTSKVRSITKTANQFIKMYENGQWTTLIKTFKSGKALEFASAHSEDMDPASEAGSFDLHASFNTDLIDEARSMPGKAGTAISGLWSLGKNFILGRDTSGVAFTGGRKALWIGSILIAIFLIIRGAIHLFINGAANLKRILKTNAEILRVSIANGGPADSIERQKKMLDYLENTADTIEYNILKSEKGAANDLAKNNREDFNPTELKNVTGSDFEF